MSFQYERNSDYNASQKQTLKPGVIFVVLLLLATTTTAVLTAVLRSGMENTPARSSAIQTRNLCPPTYNPKLVGERMVCVGPPITSASHLTKNGAPAKPQRMHER